MCLVKIVFAVFAWNTVTNYVFVSGQEKDEQADVPEEKTEPPPPENHTFVALIDILFVDGTKRQCTGTIIHDNVVVTAAHCFLDNGPKYTDIELSGSFIVIGTKKMFDTGYENYLPIERIVTHPRYKGWTADIALVFTFAGMTTDKPGYALPLVGESVSTPVDSNVTILSWGRCADDAEKEQKGTKGPGGKRRRCTSSEEDNDSCEQAGTNKPLRAGLHFSGREHSDEPDRSDASKMELGRHSNAHNSHRILGNVNMQQLSQDNSPDESKQLNEPHDLVGPLINTTIRGANQTSIRSPLQIAVTKKKLNLSKSLSRLRNRRYRRASRRFLNVNVKDQKLPKYQMLVGQRSGSNASLDRNRRRQAQPPALKENTLTIETFGFVNVQTCKKLVDKVMPALYGINTNEVVCYAADEHYISDDDSGAPAVRQGHLVAVTVGGVECDGDHVAIGMKMNCFCSWIAGNLPEQSVDWKCCKDCCRGDDPKKLRKQRNKH